MDCREVDRKADERRRRCYRLTPDGKRVLAAQRRHWSEFVDAIKRITETDRCSAAAAAPVPRER
jgi:DNA-binding PadR family transcriptional regulator